MKLRIISVYMILLFLMLIAAPAMGRGLSDIERLGKVIFFDKNLSINKNQSCAVCHASNVGWTGPDSDLNAGGSIYEGSVSNLFGNRKPPSSSYATPSPIFHAVDGIHGEFVGGNFWAGRATGEKLGNPAADQAQGPFLNPVEQALPDAACVIERVCSARYARKFNKVWGKESCDIEFPENIDKVCFDPDGMIDLSEEDRTKVNTAYDNIALSIAAFEDSSRVNSFSSKFDAYLAGNVKFKKREKKGFRLFMGKGKCANCHVLDRGPGNEPPLLTDFTFDNLGVPKNIYNPWYDMTDFNPLGIAWVDLGLGGFLDTRDDYNQFASKNYGKQKVPSLRNVDKRPYFSFVKAYMHNGYFKTLKGIVHFYNTRDIKPRCKDSFTTEADALAMDCWPEPEVSANVNIDEMGNLGLSNKEEEAIVAFMKTLSDGYILKRFRRR
jgi:cytochrome c peroxidase